MAPVAKKCARPILREPPAKRTKTSFTPAALDMCSAIHQFTLVGGADYTSKESRLEQTLTRLPAGVGAAVVFVDAAAESTVRAIVDRYCQRQRKVGLAPLLEHPGETASNASTRASSGCSDSAGTDSNGEEISETETTSSPISGCAPEARSLSGGCPVRILVADCRKASSWDLTDCQYIINYSFPVSGRKYLERAAKLSSSTAPFRVVFTFVDECDLGNRRCREVMTLLRSAIAAAKANLDFVELGKVQELQAAVQQLDQKTERHGDDEDDVGGDGDDSCDCRHCTSRIRICRTIGSRTSHARTVAGGAPRVEAVHVHVSALENMATAAPVIASRLEDHVCTIVCLHCLFCHTPWEGDENLFALPDGLGAVRVVFVLAEESSWHEYPDSGTLCGGGAAWVDMLDMASMDKTDRLIERLLDHEIDLLNGQSDRVVLMGVSQGGGQAMLRFLRSRQPLGGFVGCVTHAPTAPHVPQERDPLLEEWRPLVNCHKPIRLLAGGLDTVMPPAMVARDVERLRNVGGFSDVRLEIMDGLAHDQYLPQKNSCKKHQQTMTASQRKDEALRTRASDLHFLRRHLPSILGLSPNPALKTAQGTRNV